MIGVEVRVAILFVREVTPGQGTQPHPAQNRSETRATWSRREFCLLVVAAVWLRSRHASSAVPNDVVVCDWSVEAQVLAPIVLSA